MPRPDDKYEFKYLPPGTPAGIVDAFDHLQRQFAVFRSGLPYNVRREIESRVRLISQDEGEGGRIEVFDSGVLIGSFTGINFDALFTLTVQGDVIEVDADAQGGGGDSRSQETIWSQVMTAASFPAYGAMPDYAVSAASYWPIAYAGNVKGLAVRTDTVPAAPENWKAQVYINGVATGIICTLDNANASNEAFGTNALVAGDYVQVFSLKSIAGAIGGGDAVASVYVEWD